jgi:hypothetical protein
MPNGNSDPVHIEEPEPRAPESAARSATRRKSRRRLGRTARLRRRRNLAPLDHQDIYELTDDDINPKKTPFLYLRIHSDIEDYILEFKITKAIRKDGKLLRTYVRMTKEFSKDGKLENKFNLKDEIIYKDFFPFEAPFSKFFKTLDDAVHYSFKGHKNRVNAQQAALNAFKGENAPKENYAED